MLILSENLLTWLNNDQRTKRKVNSDKNSHSEARDGLNEGLSHFVTAGFSKESSLLKQFEPRGLGGEICPLKCHLNSSIVDFLLPWMFDNS